MFIDQFCSAESALRRLQIDDLSDFIITHIALTKLNKETVNLFEQAHRHISIPTFSDLSKFLKEQNKMETLRNPSNNYLNSQLSSRNVNNNAKNYRSKSTHVYMANTSSHQIEHHSCKICNSSMPHPLYKCFKFKNYNPHARLDLVNKYNYCYNCLGFHNIKFCKSTNTCTICHRKHHTLIHIDKFLDSTRREPMFTRAQFSTHAPLSHRYNSDTNAVSAPEQRRAPAPRPASPRPAPAVSSPARDSHLRMDTSAREYSNALALSITSASCNIRNETTVLLPTASVYVYKQNVPNKVRVFIDTGSMSHFISKACCERLNLKIIPDNSTITGIGNAQVPCLGLTTFKIFSRYDSRCYYNINARVIDSITDGLPSSPIDISNLTHIRNLPLADDVFYLPAEIDCLIGSELVPFLLRSETVTAPDSSVVAVQTTLGYIIMGKADCDLNFKSFTDRCNSIQDKSFLCTSKYNSLESLTQRFWELENVPCRVHMSPDDEACERIFKNTYSRDDTGRYIVQLPFKISCSALGNSYAIAQRRLISLEKRLDSDPKIRENYNATIQEYINKGYLSKIDNPSLDAPHYYIPHRAIYRPDKASTKTRIVLDAGCKTTSLKSLNDLLYVGPNLQCNIFDLLINLRMFSIAVTADIEKMYFQIKLDAKHHAFQRIIYRFDINSKFNTYEFNRISFGISSSPYLAMRVIRQLAADNRITYPLAAYEVENHMYMDDYVCSFDNIDIVEKTYKEMTTMLQSGGFNLVKWISNSPEIMNIIPQSHRNNQNINFDADSNNTKIIGMQWNPKQDKFQFKINANLFKCTKRSILSVTARLFDPLGLISPVTAFMKLLIQECWQHQLDWDSPVPTHIESKWIQFHNELSYLEKIQFSRHVGIKSASHITLLGFADASERCYGAAVYIRVSSNEQSAGSVKLLTSKSRVASLNKISLARLELCAALLLANLISHVIEILNKRCKVNKIYAFSDSTVTLTWIHSPAYKFHTFVANRITEIISKLPAAHWYHISGSDNPADIISRPVTPKILLNLSLWFNAPQWFTEPPLKWPIKSFQINSNNIQFIEAKPVTLTITHVVQPAYTHAFELLIDRVSSYTKLLRIIVYILRFSKRLKSKGLVNPVDLDNAEMYLIRYVQNAHFANDISALKLNKSVTNKIAKLNPFIDSNNILRVGGRLRHSQLDYGQKHPILLPSKERVIELIIDYYHLINMHTGPALLLSLIRQKFWILSARNLIRQRVHKCNKCFKLNPKNTFPPMGDLPIFRVSEVKAFVHTAVDYAGPFYITHIRKRGIKSQKAYICLFVCLTTKALHLELVSDLSSDLFLAAFKRFISRRGPVSLIYSDGGTNFIGAKRKLDEIYSFIQSKSHINYIGQILSEQRTQFKHSPPYGPHFNGLSEINVRCVKSHLFKVIGSQILTYEEFNTILVQIEGLLNSRPLCILNSDPSDITALTPNHFLNITPLKFLPAEDISDVSTNRLLRYQLLNKITSSFWRRWSQEYLTSLQQREKWNSPSKPIKPGTIVVIKDNNAHPLCWPLGIVDEIYPGKDKIIRTVKVRTSSGSYIRPVVRLCPLPSQ